MRLFKSILILGVILLAFSCTKPEDDSPVNAIPKSVTDEEFRFDYNDESLDLLEEERDGASPAMINDDEDDETGPNRK